MPFATRACRRPCICLRHLSRNRGPLQPSRSGGPATAHAGFRGAPGFFMLSAIAERAHVALI